ncbi:MAG: DoxX family membrane protein [Bdellovibrionales bacterium]|nr:DoxX family membrane protein [Bdellovibrionales bacterium]
MRSKVELVCRLLLGLMFFVFGLNGFFNFIPAPPPEGPGGEFIGALIATGYMFPMIKGFEVISGAMLLAGRMVPLALLFLAPITVNIFMFHLVLDKPIPGVIMPLFMAGMMIVLARKHWDVFAPLFKK